MPLSNSLASYEDIRALLDRALEAEHGIRVTHPTKGAAVHWRQRAYKFRLLDRARSKELYSVTSEAWGTSVYDGLVIDIDDNVNFVRKTDVNSLALKVEEL